VIEVENFPVVVTMDSKGRSLHEEILNESSKRYKSIIDNIK